MFALTLKYKINQDNARLLKLWSSGKANQQAHPADDKPHKTNGGLLSFNIPHTYLILPIAQNVLFLFEE